MPSLIRLVIILIFLGGLAFGGMVALTAVVDPGEKEIRVRIPTRDLMAGAGENGGPGNLRDQLPAPRVTAPDPAATALPEGPAPSAPASNQPAPDMSTFE
jgi:hypothetical protein